MPCHTSGLLTTYFQACALIPASAALFHRSHRAPAAIDFLSSVPLSSALTPFITVSLLPGLFTTRPSSPTLALPHRSIALLVPPHPRLIHDTPLPPSDPPYTGSILTFDHAGRPGCFQSPTHIHAHRHSAVSAPDLLLLLILRGEKAIYCMGTSICHLQGNISDLTPSVLKDRTVALVALGPNSIGIKY